MELHEQTDSQLIALLQADAETALDELMRRYKHTVVNFCYRLLGNAPDDEDVAQEVFVRVYQQRAKIDPAKKFSTWLFAVARNGCLDRLRYRKRHPVDAIEAVAEPATESREVESRELESAIAAAVA